MPTPTNFLISRTDSLGDVVLTLPVAAVLKQHFPNATIGFIGTPYTKAIVEACPHIDVFIDKADFLSGPVTLAGEKPQCLLHILPRADLAKRGKELQIPWRIGTTNRWFHWLTCNKLVKLSRSNSPLHEAQLNLKLLKPLGIRHDFTLPEIAQLVDMSRLPALPAPFAALLQADKFKLILHPKSRGSAREWAIEHYISLIKLLDTDKFQIFISGTANEQAALQPLFAAVGERVTDISGLMSLPEFIPFVAACDGLVACSTGPLHIAAALQKHALGIYPPMRPIHPGRWQPIGQHTHIFVLDKTCNDCRQDKAQCPCTQAIQPLALKQTLDKIYADFARQRGLTR
ncbi:glycosyltransferase family 9 protein [Methylovulum psychrotolerans]|uniref:Glycosyl transferase family 9 n=1 Tax=Methylovulum psychrotolerans TaxID=1704499 RepID=A0A2S5CNN1_9GAMM|nr:glycosyltransferase family 9 protein [Methylovulum psychrotolerans]POZ52429.1 glycosyl transferase family 9 [Methylovulum psychrotolerans]